MVRFGATKSVSVQRSVLRFAVRFLLSKKDSSRGSVRKPAKFLLRLNRHFVSIIYFHLSFVIFDD